MYRLRCNFTLSFTVRVLTGPCLHSERRNGTHTLLVFWYLCSKRPTSPLPLLQQNNTHFDRTMQYVCTTSLSKRPTLSFRCKSTSQPDSQTSRLLLEHETEIPDTSVVEPEADEQSDWDTVEVKDKQWTDEELMDDARPGRRVRRRVQI